MKKFIYQIEKKELEDGIELSFFLVNTKKDTELVKTTVPYTIIASEEDFEALNIKSDSILLSKKNLKNKNDKKLVKINVKNKELYEFLKNQFKEKEFKTYEADLNIEHEYLINNNTPLIVENTPLEPQKRQSNEYIEPKFLSIDIETIGDVNNQEITLISSHTPENPNYNLVYVNKERIPQNKLKEVETHNYEGFTIKLLENEKEILEAFKEDVLTYKPQILIGWNVIDFDFNVIKSRMKFHNISFKFSDFEGNYKMRVARDFFSKSNLTFPGVLVLDTIQILKTNFIVFEDYKLNTVAKEVLKDEKIDLEDDDQGETAIENKIQAIQNLLEKNPVKLIEYNFKDSLLVSKIVDKLNLLELMCKRSILTNTPFVKVQSPIASLDIMYLTQLYKKGYAAESNFNFSDTAPIEGAFVLDPKKGFYKDVFVLDFKSLYPSIIRTFNLDPFTYKENGQIEAPNGAKFEKAPGILPSLIQDLSKERDEAKKEKDWIKSHALKITMNSFYGAIASPKSRFYNKDIGEAITSFGRGIIQKAKDHIEEKGHKVIYGDTDSIFVTFEKEFKSLEEKKSFGKNIENELNSFFKNWVEKEHGQESKLTIELEKIYSNFFIATKKRYVGFDEITNKTQFVGLEAVRGDWTELAKKFQVSLVKRIFSGATTKEIETFIHNEINDLKKGKFDDLLVYKKRITKPLEQYTKTTPPHVKAARELKEFSGRLVKYVMCESGPKHVSLFTEKHNYDYDHYIDKQLKGVSDDLLEALGLDFDEIIHKKKQKSLDSFF